MPRLSPHVGRKPAPRQRVTAVGPDTRVRYTEAHEWWEAREAVILAGGLGMRLSEEAQVTPNPTAGIGEPPIVWRIMKGFAD